MGTALFWAITQQEVVISYRRFGKTYRFHLQGPRTSAPSAMVNNPNIWVLDLEDGTDRLSRNVGNTLPLFSA